MLTQDTDLVTLYFHIVAVGKDFMGAQILKQAIEKSIQSCLPYVHREVVPFFLPDTSGFEFRSYMYAFSMLLSCIIVIPLQACSPNYLL